MAATQTMLDEAEAALHRLQIGEAAQVTGYDGKTVTYTPANIAALRAYRDELKAALGQGTRRARPVYF